MICLLWAWALVYPPVGRSADWPWFLGPSGDNSSSETNLIHQFDTNGPPLLWEKSVGAGYSAPSIRSGQLVLHHRQGNEEVVECFDALTGTSKWRYAYRSTYVDPYGYNNGPRCTPLLTTNRVYTFGAEGVLTCLDLSSGRKIWQRETAKDFQIPEAFFGVGSTPILEGNTLITMVGGQPNSGMVGFDPASGETKWQSVGQTNWQGQPMIGWPGERNIEWQTWEKQASYSSPVAATVHGQRIIFCLMRQGLVGINPTNGTIHFSYWFRSRVNDSVNAMNPVVIDDKVLISGAYYKVGSVLLQIAPDLKSVKPVWLGLGLELHWNTPVYDKGNLFAFSGRNEPDALFRCVDYKTGEVRWERDERWQGHQPKAPTYGRGSAIKADGQLITLGEGGILGLFDLDPAHPVERSRAQLPRVEYPCWTAPILSEGRLYVRNERWLLCLDLRRPR